ncbi:MAG: SDR family oxidoreductase [bacterium]
MKILITGALGHIGSRLIRYLPEIFPRAEYLLLDNLFSQRYCSLFNLPGRYNYKFLEEDILNAPLEERFANVDTVIHLAAITDAAGSFKNKALVEKVNREGTERVARACAECGASLIFISTTSVYGSQKNIVDEDCEENELVPQSPYAATKLQSEKKLKALSDSMGLKYVILRFGTIFGTSMGMRFHTAINKFCWQAINGQALTVWKTAVNQKRPYLELGDAVDALGFFIQRNIFDCSIYNVLSVNATVNSVVEVIKEHIPNLSINYVDEEIMNQLSYEVLNNRIKSLGFTAKGALGQGIGETIEFLRAIYKR